MKRDRNATRTQPESHERLVTYKVDATVVDEFLRVARRAGCTSPTLSSYLQYHNKTFRKAKILMPHPFYNILVALGLPQTVKTGPKPSGRKPASREQGLKVPEFVSGAPAIKQARLDEAVERRRKQRFGFACHLRQESVRKFAADRRAHLRGGLGSTSRSSRAISDACRLAGTASAEEGMFAIVRPASPSPSASRIAFVISSTNSGTPSARSTTSCRMSGRQPSIPRPFRSTPRRPAASND